MDVCRWGSSSTGVCGGTVVGVWQVWEGRRGAGMDLEANDSLFITPTHSSARTRATLVGEPVPHSHFLSSSPAHALPTLRMPRLNVDRVDG